MINIISYSNIIIFSSIFGILVLLKFLFELNKNKVDDKKALHIASLIREGAFTFLIQEYSIIGLVVLFLSGILLYFSSLKIVISFIIGSVLSLSVGFIGMHAATISNVKTTVAARDKGEKSAFNIALTGGAVMGFAVASVGLIGLYYCLKISLADESGPEGILSAFGLGASLVAFFARVGGGIYTKSADVGADLVGKLEANIPEDDARNPAVIADNVGDCVGDTAGMGADIYESYVASMISAILLGYYQAGGKIIDNEQITFPLIMSALGLISSGITILLTRFLKLNSKSALRFSATFSVLLFILFSYTWINSFSTLGMNLFNVIVAGCLSGLFVGMITEYYTGGSPIKKLAEISESGAATNVIYGLSLGLESVVLPVIGLSGIVWYSYVTAGHYGVALTAISMLSTVGITMTIDGYGPIADNAGGIAEMAEMGKDVRTITDKLDALGNTTAAMGKGFAIGSALLAALGVFSAYAEKANITSLDLLDTLVLIGTFVGAVIPFLISALTMRSVGFAALKMVKEVRRQFKEIVGLMEGTATADYNKCIEISTKASIQEMILPGLITTFSPILVKVLFGTKALGGFLVGSTISGVLLSLLMANAGGAWDNAKKYIESGKHGGKGSFAHKSAVIGDTLGDPFKDTSGPSLNILIKLMSMISLLLVAI